MEISDYRKDTFVGLVRNFQLPDDDCPKKFGSDAEHAVLEHRAADRQCFIRLHFIYPETFLAV